MVRSLRRRVIAVALLISTVIALPAAAAPGGMATALLTLDGQSMSGFAEPSIDIGTTLAVGHATGAIELDRYAIEERFATAPSDDARRDLLFDATTRFNRRIRELRTESATLRSAARNGSIGADVYVHRAILIGTESAALRSTLDRLDDLADQVPGLSYQARIGRLDAALIGLDGPVGSRALAAIRGEGDRIRLYVSVSGDGAIMAMLDGDRYVREAYRADVHPPDTTNGIGLDQAASGVANLYPDAYNASIRRGITGMGGGVYRITFTQPRGTLTAYLDGTTESVFFEIQELGLSSVSVTDPVTASDNGTRLVVKRAIRGGPLRIETVDNVTGTPVPATVTVGDERVLTGDDGVAWTLMPPREAVRITAAGPGGTVSTTVRSLPPQPVNR